MGVEWDVSRQASGDKEAARCAANPSRQPPAQIQSGTEAVIGGPGPSPHPFPLTSQAAKKEEWG